MEAQTAKRFNLIDAIVLVAATAMGFALGRLALSDWSDAPTNDVVAAYAISVALTWTLAIFTLNLTRYLTTRRELACRPGFSALVAVVVERGFEAIYSEIAQALHLIAYYTAVQITPLGRLLYLLKFNILDVMHGGSVAAAVAAVWLITGLAGCWRPEKSWIDRIGRVLGVFWLLAAVVYWSSLWVFPPPPTSMPPFPF